MCPVGIMVDVSLPVSELSFVAIDFESAGAAPGETDQPVQIGIALCSKWHEVPELWTSYIKPGRPVTWAASQVHGITTEMLSEAPSYMSLWIPIQSYLKNRVILGHQHATERKFLRQFPGHGFGPWLDTLSLSKWCIPGLSDYSLGSVCDALGVTERISQIVPNKTWHDALYDAVASMVLWQHLVKELQMENYPLIAFEKALLTT